MNQGSFVYVAGSVTSYGTPKRQRAIEQIREHAEAQGLVVFLPEHRWTTSGGWLREWPKIVRLLGGLVIVPDDRGSIGAGVMREVSDAIAFDVPVYVWTVKGPVETFSMRTLARPTAMRAARITVNKERKKVDVNA